MSRCTKSPSAGTGASPLKDAPWEAQADGPQGGRNTDRRLFACEHLDDSLETGLWEKETSEILPKNQCSRADDHAGTLFPQLSEHFFPRKDDSAAFRTPFRKDQQTSDRGNEDRSGRVAADRSATTREDRSTGNGSGAAARQHPKGCSKAAETGWTNDSKQHRHSTWREATI